MGKSLKIILINNNNKAFSIMEMLFAIAIVTLLGTAFIQSLSYSNKILQTNKAYLGAISVADKHIENAKAIAWNELGVQSADPNGILPRNDSEQVSNILYNIENKVFWYDDPKDGLGAMDSDSNTKDYKIYKIVITWSVLGKTYSYTRVTKIYAPF